MLPALKSVRVPRFPLFRSVQSGSKRFKSDGVQYVDINNPDGSPEDAAATKHFFEYQTGRWLQNDRAERAKRFTKFDFKGLITLLQDDLEILKKNAEIETLQPMFEGKHNKLYKIVLKDNRSYVLRIPYQIGTAEYRAARLQSEAATLSYMAEHVFDKSEKFRVAQPLSYSASDSNPLKTPYMLMSFISGTKLAADWKPWEKDLEQKRGIIENLAEMNSLILKHEFPAYGSIFFANDVPEGYKTVKINDKYVIGPSMEKRFWRSEATAPFRGPFSTWREYLDATAKCQLVYAEASGKQANVSTAQRYIKFVSSMFADEASVAGEVASPRLYDPDISPLNVISQENGEKLWLIDVENSAVKPYMLHGLPWFVRNTGERIYSTEDIADYENMSEDQKGIVQHMIALTQNEFTYERALRKFVPELIMAHHPNLKRFEELVHRAMNTDIDTEFHNDLNYSMLHLLELWSMLCPNQEPPIKLSEQETAELMTAVMKFNDELVRNRFLESKNFVPADVFDKLLGTGMLKVLDEKVGNYALSDEFVKKQGLL